MRRPPAQVDIDDRLVRRANSLRRFGPHHIRERQAGRTDREGTQLQKTPPTHTVAVPLFASEKCQHDGPLLSLGESETGKPVKSERSVI